MANPKEAKEAKNHQVADGAHKGTRGWETELGVGISGGKRGICWDPSARKDSNELSRHVDKLKNNNVKSFQSFVV